MAPNSALATDILNSVSSLWKDENLADFTVEIGETFINCHRFILAACSRFFYVLFTTDMKEKKNHSVRLHEIELSAFELILKVLYTGVDVVNEENVVSIWQCANRLHIPFLVERCEKFAVSVLSIDNYAEFYRAAKVLDSKSLLGGLKEFILKNFMAVKEDEFFLELSADELIELIQNDELDVTSEDDVLFSVFKWIENSPDKELGISSEFENLDSDISSMPTVNVIEASCVELHHKAKHNSTFYCEDIAELLSNGTTKQKPSQSRSVHLESLIKASRSCLASPYCLQNLYRHRLTQSDEGARNAIFDAILYQVKGYRHGYFPTAALLRNCAEFEHVGVIGYDTGSFKALSFARNKWYLMPACPEVKNKIKIALFDRNMYAVGPVDDSISKLCVLKDASWASIAVLPGLRYFLLSHETFLYVFNASNGEIFRMQPNSYDKSLKNLEHPEDMKNSEFALSFNEYIIVFSKDSHNGIDETTVHVMNSRNETWHRLENLTGSAKNMVSFRDGEKVYLLQNNGNLWNVFADNLKMIAFQFLKKLWDTKESLRGALLYKNKLFLYLKLPRENPNDSIMTSLPGVYKSVHSWARNGYASNFIFTIMHSEDLIET